LSIIQIHKRNEVFIEIVTERSILQELSDYFSFFASNYKFMPAYRNKVWDGKIRLLNIKTNLLYSGLIPYLEKFCHDRDYTLERYDDFHPRTVSNDAIDAFLSIIRLTVEPRYYQLEALVHAVQSHRGLLLSPTASGKSLIIYMLCRWYDTKTLIIVPTTSLVHQMASDFESYGYKGEVHKIFSGREKENPNAKYVVTTWQSIYKMPRQWFAQYNVVIGDECHLFKAASLTSIMEKLTDCKYRFGFTGTLDGTEVNKLVLTGLFGDIKQVTTTNDLMTQGHVAELKIKALLLDHTDQDKKLAKTLDYQGEMDFLVSNAKRNQFIKNLVNALDGNTLVLFQYIEKHGKILKDLIESTGRKVHYVDGSVSGEKREDIRSMVENEYGSVIVASYATLSTGVNIRNLHNVIFASPSKSRIRNLQSIGRGLRKSDTKESCTLYDISDDLSWKTRKNYTLLHFGERIKTYAEENFDYKITRIRLSDI